MGQLLDLLLTLLIFLSGPVLEGKVCFGGFTIAAESGIARQTTILGENMTQRVMPFAERTNARTLGFGSTADEWAAMTPQQRWRLNDGQLRARINEGDAFRYIGQLRALEQTQEEIWRPLFRLEAWGILGSTCRIKSNMNPENLQSNDDLATYLIWLGKRLGNGGESALADDVVLASRFASGSASEFLHEAQIVLEKVVGLSSSPLTNEEIEGAKSVVTQIKAAFRKVGGA